MARGQTLHTQNASRSPWLKYTFSTFILLMIISLPWEWYRLYRIKQEEKYLSLRGYLPISCFPSNAENINSVDFSSVLWLQKECKQWHELIIWNAVWDVSPLQSFTILLTKMTIEPFQHISFSIGRSFAMMLNEVPREWQQQVMILLCFFIMLTVFISLWVIGIEIHIPFLRITRRGNHNLVQSNKLQDTMKRLEFDHYTVNEAVHRIDSHLCKLEHILERHVIEKEHPHLSSDN